ncbi:MAG: DUF1673 family protein [Methanosarcinaceae archaeon]|nr:DUF1673 family protein [Methanosarcinaceae archaeon]
MAVFPEGIKKLMGWCPQKDFTLMQAQKNCSQDFSYTNPDQVRVSSKSIERMNIPIQMLAFRRLDVPIQMLNRRWTVVLGFMGLAFVLGLVGLVSVREWGVIGEYMVLCLLILLALLFIFDRTKISMHGGMLNISTPIFGDVTIPENDIQYIEVLDNYTSRHKLRNSIALIFMIVLSISNAITMKQNTVMNMLYLIAPLVFLLVLYIGFRRSHYPKTIKMKVKMKARDMDILFYPRNESEFLVLKDIAWIKQG